MKLTNIPGTNMAYEDGEDAFSMFRPMLEVTGGLSLSQVCSLTGLQASTIQNWVKRSYVPHPVNKKYEERHLARILLISALRDCINIEQIGELMISINGDTDDENDDIVSESKLYDYYVRSIRQLNIESIDDNEIEKTVKDILNTEMHKDELVLALKMMIYAYISSKMYKKSDECLKLIIKGKEGLNER